MSQHWFLSLYLGAGSRGQTQLLVSRAGRQQLSLLQPI